jgi:hypothetical protein
MVTSNRQSLLETIEERHAALIAELDALDARVEAALVACGAAPRAEEAPLAQKQLAN